jgi:hypothetical protein
MLDKRRATDFLDQLDLDNVHGCPLCLLELAREMREGRDPSTGSVQRTAPLVWPEIEIALRLAVVEARMAEVPDAEQALDDLDTSAWRSPLVRAVVTRLAQRLVDEMSERRLT